MLRVQLDSSQLWDKNCCCQDSRDEKQESCWSGWADRRTALASCNLGIRSGTDGSIFGYNDAFLYFKHKCML